MISSGAVPYHKRRTPYLKKTDAMLNAERQNGKILNEIWRTGLLDSFQVGFCLFNTCLYLTYLCFLFSLFFQNLKN